MRGLVAGDDDVAADTGQPPIEHADETRTPAARIRRGARRAGPFVDNVEKVGAPTSEAPGDVRDFVMIRICLTFQPTL
jgi:hypothetical protein